MAFQFNVYDRLANAMRSVGSDHIFSRTSRSVSAPSVWARLMTTITVTAIIKNLGARRIQGRSDRTTDIATVGTRETMEQFT